MQQTIFIDNLSQYARMRSRQFINWDCTVIKREKVIVVLTGSVMESHVGQHLISDSLMYSELLDALPLCKVNTVVPALRGAYLQACCILWRFKFTKIFRCKIVPVLNQVFRVGYGFAKLRVVNCTLLSQLIGGDNAFDIIKIDVFSLLLSQLQRFLTEFFFGEFGIHH
ncbi:hypothetical protein D3C74_386820 [compost metagenome]